MVTLVYKDQIIYIQPVPDKSITITLTSSKSPATSRVDIKP